jgi:hypothetical protein
MNTQHFVAVDCVRMAAIARVAEGSSYPALNGSVEIFP